MLARRTAIQQDLNTSPTELVLGTHPHLPADLIGTPEKLLSTEQIKNQLDNIRTKAARPAIQTSHHGTQPEYKPEYLKTITHVLFRKGKTTLLGPQFEGPFEIVARLSDSRIKLCVENYEDGTLKFQVQSW